MFVGVEDLIGLIKDPIQTIMLILSSMNIFLSFIQQRQRRRDTNAGNTLTEQFARWYRSTLKIYLEDKKWTKVKIEKRVCTPTKIAEPLTKKKKEEENPHWSISTFVSIMHSTYVETWSWYAVAKWNTDEQKQKQTEVYSNVAENSASLFSAAAHEACYK